MDIRHVTDSITDLDHDLVCVPVFGEPGKDASFKALDKARDGQLAALATREGFVGKPGQTLTLTSAGEGPGRLVLFGFGPKREFALADLKNLAARATRLGRQKGARRIALVAPSQSAKRSEHAEALIAEGAILGEYKFDKYFGDAKKKNSRIESFDFVLGTGGGKKPTAAQKRKSSAAIKHGVAVASGVCHARDMVNEPAAVMTPSQLAAEARKLAKKYPSLSVKVLGEKECEKLNMRMYLAVGQGSAQESKLVHLTYKPKRAPKKRIVLVGKGVTFDSGGYSLKPSSSMEDMKIDMAGAAAVIGAMGAIAQVGCPYEVHAITASAENMVSGGAYRLGDVLHAADGTHVEINNTDAEGRLTLGDAITYARNHIAKLEAKDSKSSPPVEMFDFATLTGACMVALGPHTAAVMSTDDKLAKRWLSAAGSAGEDMWRLPLNPRLKEQLKSNIADMRNTGERWGGAITAGLFLRHFAKDTPWVHVDIAGPASANRENGAVPKGGTGFAVATILEYVSH